MDAIGAEILFLNPGQFQYFLVLVRCGAKISKFVGTALVHRSLVPDIKAFHTYYRR